MSVRARVLVADATGELEVGFARLGLPRPAREYLSEKLPLFHLLLTGLSREEARFLSGSASGGEAPGREEFPQFVAGDQAKRPGTALLSGRREQLERLVEEAGGELGAALSRALATSGPPAPLVLGESRFEFGARTWVMGIVNVTPDSFSDGGRFFSTVEAVAHGTELVRAGADLLDLGGESTRPGSKAVSVDEELSRVVPVIRALRERTQVPLSIDTTKAAVAREALAAGATLVNDISGFSADPLLPSVVAEANAACCLMHLEGTLETMHQVPPYEDVMESILAHLEQGIERAVQAGIPRERLLVDPGIGFGKSQGQNLFALRRLRELRCLGLPVLLGTSRKRFIGELTGRKQASERVSGTMGSIAAAAALNAVDIVRVHDVGAAREALAVVDAIRLAREGGDAYLTSGIPRVKTPGG